MLKENGFHVHLSMQDQVELVNQIIQEAIEKGASDIHFEPYAAQYRIRFRLDGILSERYALPFSSAERITARLKILANLDTSEKRLPQDGRIHQTFSGERSLDLRISSCPTVFGEKIVLRILDKSATTLQIDALGMETKEQALFVQQLEKPQGLILVTGPTGSGKTVTLYSALNHLNKPERNISTAEDPIEINMPGINQVNINPKAGLDFAAILRAFLRQDPDVLMVGEIRDRETAEIAIKAALTGHLVLSTIHTNSAFETITRLLDLGIPAFNIRGALRLVIAQRLIRQLCVFCKEPALQFYQALGCSHCNQGYKGRVGIFEFMPISKSLCTLLSKETPADEILAELPLQGLQTLYQAGLAKVKLGITSIDEVNRVAMD